MSTALQKTTRPSLFATRCCFTIRQSLIAIHFRFTGRQSLFAIRYSLPFFSRPADLPTSFGSAGASPSQILAD